MLSAHRKAELLSSKGLLENGIMKSGPCPVSRPSFKGSHCPEVKVRIPYHGSCLPLEPPLAPCPHEPHAPVTPSLSQQHEYTPYLPRRL